MKEKPKKKKNKDISINILCTAIIIIYFFSLKLIHINYEGNIIESYEKTSCIIFLVISIVTIEKSYRKNDKKIAIYGIESLIIAIYILLIERMVEILKIDINSYLTDSVIIITMYYVIKCILIDTIEKRNELKQLSDIKDIVKKEKPVKKVAKKRKI